VHNARALIAEGLLTPPHHFSFVMGVPGAAPADIHSLLAMIDALPAAACGAALASAAARRS